jgi:transcriptional regulator with XRE-family HTH domain
MQLTNTPKIWSKTRGICMSFKEKLAELMQLNGVTNYKMAKSIGCSQSSVANWLKGTMPDTGKLQLIADYFEVTAGYLLGTENENSPAGNDANGAIPGFDELSEANQAIVRSMIDQLLAAQSNQ